MLHGLVNSVLGRSTRSGRIFSPFDVDPYAVSDIDIYQLISDAEEARRTRESDQHLVQLEPIPADADYDPASDPDYDFIPFEAIDLELNLDLPPPALRPPSLKKRATPSAAKTPLPLYAARARAVSKPPPMTPKPVLGVIRVARPRPANPVPPLSARRPIMRTPRAPITTATPLPPFPCPDVAAPSPTPAPLGIIRCARPAPPTPAPTLGIIRCARPAPPSSSSTTQARTPRQDRKSAYHKVSRRKHRQAEQLLMDHPTKKVVQRRIQEATPLFAALDVATDLHTTSTAWIGLRVRKPDMRAYSLEELRSRGLSYLAWDGRVCRPLLDAKRRVFACLGGRPRKQSGGDSYDVVIKTATAAFAQAAAIATGDGRRGAFVAVSTGVSYGGGQLRPGNLLNSQINATVCASLVANWAVQRIAQFSNSMFRSFAPDLHAFYSQQMRALYIAAPYLRRLFPEAISVFASCTFNLGPSTVTFPHIDAANLAWGWCCITALGNFNPDLGGHLILWDLNLIIRFPPGSTILIPSALLRHSNIAIQQGETRYSFTQFSAGGLFRWVNNGHRSDAAFYAKASTADVEDREADRGQRWENGVRMFKVWKPAASQ